MKCAASFPNCGLAVTTSGPGAVGVTLKVAVVAAFKTKNGLSSVPVPVVMEIENIMLDEALVVTVTSVLTFFSRVRLPILESKVRAASVYRGRNTKAMQKTNILANWHACMADKWQGRNSRPFLDAAPITRFEIEKLMTR